MNRSPRLATTRELGVAHLPTSIPVFSLGIALLIMLGACLPASIRPTPSASGLPASSGSTSPTPAPSPSPSPASPTPAPGPPFVLHTVVGGDTLTSLARKFGTSGRSIAYWNRETYPTLDPESANYQPNNLKRGWLLRILRGAEYSPPPDDGETGEQATPTPDDSEDYESGAPAPSN